MKRLLNGFALLILSFPFLTGCQAESSSAGPADFTVNRVDRGKYLVSAMGCNDCHTQLKMTDRGSEPDMTRMLSSGGDEDAGSSKNGRHVAVVWRGNEHGIRGRLG